ncbi:MAG: DegT/DnrJ/EryC1/StrS family aminotransferase [Candidatus Rokubacteria bacterium]|nr:DegT/DnrJ/EryC1/StrS family aminotransferase [Candidatus Rokubacteria bacterium]
MDGLALLGGPRAVPGPIPRYCSLGPEEAEAARRVVASGVLSAFFGSAGANFLGGPEVKAFEREWADAFGAAHAVSVNSATSGLIAAVGACGIGPGDEVIVSPFTMSASASCVRVLGGTPVFADLDAATFNLDPRSVAACITPRTRAIIVVDLAGQPADLDELLALARPRGIRVIEDAAQAPGALYKGRWAGTLADIGVFSLNCHKTIQTGEGGVCCTDDAALALRLQLIRNHGEGVVEEMGITREAERLLGFNFRLGEIEAAIGREQLRKLARLTTPRQENARVYDRRLGALPGLTVPLVKPDRTHVYYTYMMRIDPAAAGMSRRQVVRALAAEGVECFEGYCRPLYLQPLYQAEWSGKDGRKYGSGLCPVTERLYQEEVFFHSLLYEELRTPWVDQICHAFEKVWAHRDELAMMEDDGARAIRRA